MRYFRHDIDGPEVHLYPIVCWHVGAKQSSIKFINEVIRQIADDPLARWIYLGDGGECVTKSSKGNIYEQLLSPGDQLRVVAGLLQPVKDKGLFGIRGNHGNRIDKETGMGWDENLCARIGIPYMGVSCLGNILLKTTSTSKRTVSVYCHHGTGGSVTAGGKMAAGHRAESFIVADVILTAHTHACGECWPARQFAYTDGRTREIKWSRCRSFVCGSAYDSRQGYAEEKMYSPLLPEHIVINLRAGRLSGGYSALGVTHRKIESLGDEYASSGNLAKWRGEISDDGVLAHEWMEAAA